MFELKLVLTLLLFIIIIVGLPVFSIRLLRLNGKRKLLFFIPTILFCFIVYNIFIALYPNEEFYVEEFELNTGYGFPKSGKFIKKDATYPDIHGDYSAVAIVQFPESDYLLLKNTFESDSLVTIDTSSIPLDRTINLLNSDVVKMVNIEIVYVTTKKNQFKIGFLNDKKTIVFERVSS